MLQIELFDILLYSYDEWINHHEEMNDGNLSYAPRIYIYIY